MDSLEELEAAAFDNALEENSLALSELSPAKTLFLSEKQSSASLPLSQLRASMSSVA